jgi:hypothetical protein
MHDRNLTEGIIGEEFLLSRFNLIAIRFSTHTRSTAGESKRVFVTVRVINGQRHGT